MTDCKCIKCGNVWTSRSEAPRVCTKCKTTVWDKFPGTKRREYANTKGSTKPSAEIPLANRSHRQHGAIKVAISLNKRTLS